MASTYKVSGEFATADYLKAAEDAFAYLEKNNLSFANDGKENIVDDDCALHGGHGVIPGDQQFDLQGRGR